MIFSQISLAQERPYIILGDREYVPKYQDYARGIGEIYGYNPEFSYPLAQFSAYSSSQSYRNPVELREAGLVDSSNRYFGEILYKNNFDDIQLVHQYQTERFDIDEFLKSYGGLWRFIRKGSNGNIDIDSPKIKNLAKASTQAIVGYKWVNVNGDTVRVISITFRGTEGLNKPEEVHEDWLINAISAKDSMHKELEDVKVHRGYLACVQAFQDMEKSIYLGSKTLREIIDEAKYSKDIFILNGHSSGGAMAAIYGAMLVDEKINNVPRENIAVYSFGAPPFTDQTFERRYFSSDNITNMLTFHRIVERYDIVPYSNRGVRAFDYVRDVVAGFISENKYLNKSRLLAFIFRTNNPEFRQIGSERVYDQGVFIEEDSDMDSKRSAMDRIYFFIEEVTRRKLKHHTMSWYISVLNQEAINHPRGDLTPPRVYREIKNSEIILFSDEEVNIYYSLGDGYPSIRPYEYEGGYRRVNHQGSKVTYFAIDKSGNMSKVRSIDIRRNDTINISE